MKYDNSCPIYVVDGSSGNDYYVEMNAECNFNFIIDQPRNFSASIVYGTGYGILLLDYNQN